MQECTGIVCEFQVHLMFDIVELLIFLSFRITNLLFLLFEALVEKSKIFDVQPTNESMNNLYKKLVQLNEQKSNEQSVVTFWFN